MSDLGSQRREDLRRRLLALPCEMLQFEGLAGKRQIPIANVLRDLPTAPDWALGEIERALDRPAPVDAPPPAFVYSDGGRQAAGFKGSAGDCAVRAIAIATQLPYERVHADLEYNSPGKGLNRRAYEPYLNWLGWHRTHDFENQDVRMRMRMRADELPTGRLIVRSKEHLAAVVDGVLYDTYDSSRDGKASGTAPVLGIFQPARSCVYAPVERRVDPEPPFERFNQRRWGLLR